MIDLIVGGTKGLGLEIARGRAEAGETDIIVAGRTDPEVDFADFAEFDLNRNKLGAEARSFIGNLPTIRSLVYAPGFYQEGHITDLSDEDIEEMIRVCGSGLMYFTRAILESQGELPELLSITSTSQERAREKESAYNFAKAGAGLFTEAVSLDPRVKKVLLAAPSAMDTSFWDKTERGEDRQNMLDPAWVALKTAEQFADEYDFRYVKILGEFEEHPDRVEHVKTLPVENTPTWKYLT